MIVVDNRWSGQNGIGRYAAEVLPRLGFEWTPIEAGSRPSSPVDFFAKRVSVDGHTPEHIYSPGFNGFLRRIPQTITVMDLIHLTLPNAMKFVPYFSGFLRPLIRRNRHVITISDTSAHEIATWLRDPSVEVINAGIGSSPAFTPEGTVWDEQGQPYVVYVGSLSPHKNVETLLRAMRLVDDVRIVLVTPDPASTRALLGAHDLLDRATVLTGIDDPQLASVYRGALATVSPSLIEGFGLPAQESALCGTPVIFWEGCATIGETVAGHGIAVGDAGDEHEWAAAIASVAPGTRFAPGVVTHERFSWDRVAAAVTDTVERYL